MAQQKVHLTREQDLLAGLHAVRDEVKRPKCLGPHQSADPVREERERECVSRCDRQRRCIPRADGACVPPSLLKPTDEIVDRWLEMRAGRRKRGALGSPREQGCADPVLEGTDPPAEGGLGDVPHLGRTRKCLLLREGQEVLQPVQFHADAIHA